MTWPEWITKHSRTFGLFKSQELEMLNEWSHTFAAQGYEPAELAQATAELATDPPRFRQDHLRRLLDSVRRERDRLAGSPATEPPRVACAKCQGTGRVTVPQPTEAERGRYAALSVLCDCQAGRWILSNQRQFLPDQGKEPQWTLERYENSYPEWREWMRDYWARWKSEAAALRRAGDLDHTLGPIEARLRAITRRGQGRE